MAIPANAGRERFPAAASTFDVSSMPTGKVRSVTPNDSTDLSLGACRALWVGGAGNVAIIAEEDDTVVVWSGVPAGTILPVRAKRVRSTSTTATNILALY